MVSLCLLGGEVNVPCDWSLCIRSLGGYLPHGLLGAISGLFTKELYCKMVPNPH